MVVYWYNDVVPTFEKIVPPAVVPGLLGGNSAPPDSREKCSQSVPRPSWVLPHRDAWCLLRYLLLSLCLDLWTFRSRGIIYTSVSTLFPTFCFDTNPYSIRVPARIENCKCPLCFMFQAVMWRCLGSSVWRFYLDYRSQGGVLGYNR